MYQVKLTESFFPARADTPYRETTVARLLREQADTRRNELALQELLEDASIGRTWTYAELLADCEKLGRALASRHPAGARIAIWASNCPEWVLMQYAAMLAGLTVVTVNPAYIARELRYVLEQSGAVGLYHSSAVRGRALGPVAEEACYGLANAVQQFDISDMDTLLDGPENVDLRETHPDHIMQIQYTSGTTGLPKGVLLKQGGVLQNNADIVGRWGVEPGDGILVPTPLFHAGGSAFMFGALTTGAVYISVPYFDPALMINAIESTRPRFTGGVPTMLVLMVDEVKRSGKDMSSVERMMCGAAMVAPELAKNARSLFGAPVHVIYGQTEAAPGITFSFADDSEEDLTQTIGQPLPHMDVAILNPSDNSVCAIGEQGEICVRGYNVMHGYNDNPEATADAIDQDGWLHSGDLGTMDERGYLKITGRVKEMIIKGGENLFPAEIENAMLEHPMVAEVAVAGVPDDKYGELVACFMRAVDGQKPDENELRTFIRERLSPQKTPSFWLWVEEWPMTGSGKIQKFALSEAFVRGDYNDQLA
ncbi:class I adenylate-forming enzyme family protein [Parasphingorhabdus halotolerans]|uniref:AMP-binding protein n=1 Tax=Parasphingorhabdus halotolerans TaxID=2725558 RepID=A0A6H2DM90_9SPHN|nr:AMP-binding protein [Parasphingorhabdus halotolerans]QJB68871.1 AMP-binding protein [Parasphingorhabdus halotolerans]